MKISVLTPSYNAGKYINRAIQSVLSQSYSLWEHIVVDGGSDDSTRNILSQYDHIIWVSEPDKGQSDAMNKAFAMSTGDIIVYLNADDELEGGAFDAVIEYFYANPDCMFLTGILRLIEDNKTYIFRPSDKFRTILDHRGGLFPLNPVQYYYRREVQEHIGDIPIGLHLAMDYWFILRVYKDYKAHRIDRVLGTFHNHLGNKTTSSGSVDDICQGLVDELEITDLSIRVYLFMKQILRKIRRTLPLPNLHLFNHYNFKIK